jgi:hypothetical protein
MSTLWLDRLALISSWGLSLCRERGGATGRFTLLCVPGVHMVLKVLHTLCVVACRTFKPETWFGKPQSASPPQCALRGWINTGTDTISCSM